MDWLRRLQVARDKPNRLVIGLNSGTSADAIDVAVVRLEGFAARTRVTTLQHREVPLPRALSRRILDAASAMTPEICALNFAIGEAFADAARSVLDRMEMTTSDVDFIGSHGQTIFHQPRSAGFPGATMQIGEGAVIAERLGVPVIGDFRVRDVAAGGEGAPLVPLVDYYLFHVRGRVRALQNIGGIANVTIVPEDLDGVFAFDTGPGNMALDEVTRVASGATESFDRDGARAARGRIDPSLLLELHRMPFFSLPPPRSTGREVFGADWVRPLIDRFAACLDDLIATLARFTAETIRRSYAEHVEPRTRVDEVLVSGGGVHNTTLMRHLAELFAPIPVGTTDDKDMIDPDAKEAIAFAVLANETVHGLPGNVPAATGARGPRVLGKIIPP
jgi:anhydro-N-acetylmuramic acid kinase